MIINCGKTFGTRQALIVILTEEKIPFQIPAACAGGVLCVEVADEFKGKIQVILCQWQHAIVELSMSVKNQ